MRKSINFLFSDKRARAIICSIIEVFLLNHTSAVFQNVEYVLREQNYFPSKNEDQLRIAYARLFTAIVIACNVMKIFTTVVYDYVGSWIPRVICHLMQIVGLMFLLIATPSSPTEHSKNNVRRRNLIIFRVIFGQKIIFEKWKWSTSSLWF